MDLLAFHFDNINWVAVAVALVPSFVIGSLWYSPPVFGKYWMKAARLKQKDIEKVGFAKPMAITTIMNIIMVVGLAVLMSALYFDSVMQGAALGALVSLGFVATNNIVHSAFENRPFGLVVINSLHDVLFLTAAGAILGSF